MPKAASSRTTSTTFELRMSAQSSLKVRPRTTARAPVTLRPCEATHFTASAGYVVPHRIVDVAAGKDHLRVQPELSALCVR